MIYNSFNCVEHNMERILTLKLLYQSVPRNPTTQLTQRKYINLQQS